ncbi:LysR substrate-binding domain-containing protein [Sphingopyxis sp.]|uniref:LysR substrate-binding domain-containing protein n=1 Tax=Sphingopyxis sp. TaxID=1908224 RepID=UPI0026195685|nr:LysR substrate-binding domain-containing protein [Sphingopyxis sp.]MCW0200075.1 LysR substrate-binding domain-containing protein [Sphingopyxis sp.]
MIGCACRSRPRRSIAAARDWLCSVPWVLREEGSGTRSTFEAALAPLGLTFADLDVIPTLPSNEAVRSAVNAGAGRTLISTLVVEPLLRAGRNRRSRRSNGFQSGLRRKPWLPPLRLGAKPLACSVSSAVS